MSAAGLGVETADVSRRTAVGRISTEVQCRVKLAYDDRQFEHCRTIYTTEKAAKCRVDSRIEFSVIATSK